MSVVRWKLTDVRTGTFHVVEINPNDGGSISLNKAVATHNPIGPGRRTILSEGRITPGPQEFSGSILTQEHFEALEEWALKRTLIQVEDDLGRKFQGVLTSWQPHRVRRTFNPWYHTYSAVVTVSAFTTAAGVTRFGYMQPVGV